MRTLLYGLLFAMAASLVFPFSGGAAQGLDLQARPASGQESGAGVRELPDYDAFGASTGRRPGAGARGAAPGTVRPQFQSGRAVQFEPRLGVPTFLWAADQGPARGFKGRSAEQRRTDAADAARAHLGRHASWYRLGDADVAGARVASVHDTGRGAVVVKLKQEIGGVEVFRDELKVIMSRDLQLVAFAGYLTGEGETVSLSQEFNLGPADALARAVGDLTGAAVEASAFVGAGEQTPYLHFGTAAGARGFSLASPARVKRVMYHLADGYVAGYYVEVEAPAPGTGDARAYSYVISAVDGRLLFRNNLVSHAGTPFTYRVWADPATGIPYDTPAGTAPHPKPVASPDAAQAPFVAPNDVTIANYAFSRNDPWLAADATGTVGNNVDAFVNLFNPDGYGPVAAPADPATGDFRAQLTGAGAFQHTHTPNSATLTTAAARQAGVVQLFYTVNFLHDWFYDAGFDEAAGNAQASNYGRGGLEGDSIRAQAQDVAGTNNADMLTPADGGRPRMRMYIFDSYAVKYLDVQSPAGAAGQRSVGTATFGQQTFDVTNNIVYAAPTNGCTALTNAAQVAGKFVMIDMSGGAGSCSVGTKINNGMNSGAAGYILVNSSTQPNNVLNVSGSLPSFTIPFLSISWNSAASIKTQLAASQTVTARMRREPGERRDGAVDNQLIAHEWGHYISNRLIGDANGLNTNHAGGLGEGWSDFHAMLLTVRQEDAAAPGNESWQGTYALATYATSGVGNQGYYYGIRRYPYSTDMTKNPLTFKHIKDGEALPVTAPVNANGVANSQVHNAGEVWATMLWECYAALLRDTTGPGARLSFAQAQDRMKNYLVAAYKMTPVSPTLLEARDALLAAAAANDPVDAERFGAAFAKRGAGLRAVAPDRYSLDNAGLEESFVAGGDLALDSVTVDDSVYSCDNDGRLDNNEQGKLTVRVRNTGGDTLSNPTVSLAISNTSVTSLDGVTRALPPLGPNQTATVTFTLTATGLSTYAIVDFAVAMEDPGQAIPGQVIGHYHTAFNYNETANASAEDDVESANTVWTTATNTPIDNGGYGTWRRVAEGLTNHYWHGPDLGAGSEQSLVSPQLSTGPEGFTVTFRHRYWFEFDGGGNYDGGVIEVSTDGGATWTDVGASLYNGTITNYGASDVNPLKGRPGFVQQSASYPNFLTYSIDLTGAEYQNQSNVKLRFRLGSDGALGAQGWDIDDLFITGLTNTPFPTVTANTGVCCPQIGFAETSLPAGTVGAPLSVTLTTTGGAAPYSYKVTGTLPSGAAHNAAVAGNTLTVSGTPTQAGSFPIAVDITDANGCTGTVNLTLVVNKAAQTINFTAPTDKTYGAAPFDLAATATSGLSVSFGVVSGPATLSGNKLTLNGVGTVTVRATQAGDSNHNAATAVERSFNVAKGQATLTLGGLSHTYDGSAKSATVTTNPADLTGVSVTYSRGGTAVAAPTSAGSYDVVASLTHAEYQATNATGTLVISKAAQTVNFNAPAGRTFGDAPFALSATASSSLPVTFEIVAGPATVSGGTVTVNGAGTVTVRASQAGDANYQAAPAVERSFNVGKAQATLTLGGLSHTFDGAAKAGSVTTTPAGLSGVSLAYSRGGNPVAAPTDAGSYDVAATLGHANYQATDVNGTLVIAKAGQSITFARPADRTFGVAPFTLSATATSGLPVSFEVVSGPATVSGATLAVNGVGTVTVRATQDGGANHNAAPSVERSFAVDKAQATLTLGGLSHTFDGTAKGATVSTTPGALDGVTLSYSRDGAAVSAPTGAGSYAVTATLSHANYQADAATGSLVIGKAAQTINFVAPADKAFGAAPFDLAATATSGLPVSFEVVSGPATLSGNTLSIAAAGAVTVRAVQGGDGNHNAATAVERSFNVGKAEQSITFGQPADRSFGDAPFTLSATASSGLPVSFEVVSGPASVNGNTLTLTGAGAVTIRATQTGDADRQAAPNVERSFTAARASVSTVITSSVNPSAVDQPVTFTATVTSAAGTPNGSVTFKDGTEVLGTSALDGSGAVTYTTSSLAAGTHAVTAEYGGSADFNAGVGSLAGGQTVNAPEAEPEGGVLQLAAANYTVAEGAGSVELTVERTGDTSRPAAVDYADEDGSVPAVFVPCAAPTGAALGRCDYTNAAGTLSFAPGETAKTFLVLISEDTFVEGQESARLVLRNPTGGAVIGARGAAVLNITDDDAAPGGNPADEPAPAVEQHYHDFLNREPDAAGLEHWAREVGSCGADAACREVKRVNVSAAFFLSIEFQETGYLTYRAYAAAFGAGRIGGAVPLTYAEFIPDVRRLGRDVVVGREGWEAQLETNKQAYFEGFVGRPAFTDAHPSGLTAEEFVGRLNANAGGVLSAEESAALASQGATDAASPRWRARVLRAVAENAALRGAAFNRAFVLMQYFGYLRRDPNAAPDADFAGFDYWLAKLDQFGGDFQKAEMVKAFISSTEYRRRFGAN